MLLFGFGKDILGIGERRDPTSIQQLRIPAAMVGVEVSTKDIVNYGRMYSGCRQPLKER